MSADANTPPTPDEVDDLMAQIDGINGAAGHELKNPELRGILQRQIAGEISGDEARALGRKVLEER